MQPSELEGLINGLETVREKLERHLDDNALESDHKSMAYIRLVESRDELISYAYSLGYSVRFRTGTYHVRRRA